MKNTKSTKKRTDLLVTKYCKVCKTDRTFTLISDDYKCGICKTVIKCK